MLLALFNRTQRINTLLSQESFPGTLDGRR
jgi:hypothetical protein